MNPEPGLVALSPKDSFPRICHNFACICQNQEVYVHVDFLLGQNVLSDDFTLLGFPHFNNELCI